MTRSKIPASQKRLDHLKKKNGFEVEFVNIPINSDDKEAIQGMDISPEQIWLELEEIAQNGYKISLSCDLENTGGIASITGKRGCVPDTNDGKCMVSRGPDITFAVYAMLYKLRTFCVDGHFPSDVAARHSDFS